MDTKYVISLDALDLSVLPFTYQPRSNTMPVSDHPNELCEFEIDLNDTSMNEQSVTENLTQSSKRNVKTIRNEAIETTMCHMCRVNVPKQFLKEHKNSSKHNTYKTIVDISLQRVKEYIHDEDDSDESELNSLTYFCSHCVAVVNINDKQIHDNSLSHKNSVFFDKSLSNLVDIYKHVDKNDNNENDLNKLTTATKSSDKNENGGNNFDLKNYLKILKDKYKMPMTIKVIDEERLEIEIKGHKLEVATENFHGIKISNNEYIECIVCKEVEVGDKVEHIMSTMHMYRVSTPLIDFNCKREIYPFWHHCVLCNVIIDNYNWHTFDPVHQELLHEAFEYESDDNSIYSENSESNASDTQSQNEARARNLQMKLDSASVAERDFHKYMIEETEAPCLVNCSVCEIILRRDDDRITAHTRSVNHIKKYAKFLQKHQLVLQDGNMYCNICKVYVGLKGEIIHVRGKRHLKFLENTEVKPSTSLNAQ